MSTHGSGLYFALEDSAGTTLRDLSSNLNSVDFSREQDTHDDTTFGQSGHTFKGGLTNGTIQLQGFYDITVNTGTDVVLRSLVGHATPVDFEYGPVGNTAGDAKKSGACVLESYNVSQPVADLVSFTATLRISGAVTQGTFV